MNKERVKSIILVLLVIVNLVLAEKIFVNKKLWPSGYNFFSIGNRKNDYSVTGHLAVPQKIIVNTGYQSSRFEYLRSGKEFYEIFSAADEVLKKAFKSPLKSVSNVSQEDWYSVLGAKSIYIRYPCSYSAQIFANLSGNYSTELNFENFSDIVISENGNVYICDKNGANYYRISTFSSAISPIIEQVSESHYDEDAVINYSFEMNFDKNPGEQKTTLSPMISIYSDSVAAEIVSSSNPAVKDGAFNNKVISNILTAFHINPNTLRRHTEADGSQVFVENNGILRLSPDGILTFAATNTGIKLSDSETQGTYANLSLLAEFIDNVNSAAGADADMYVTSSLTGQNTENFSFDYIVNGIPVKFDGKSAVTATVSGGYIKEYTQILRKYSGENEYARTPLYIEALDSAILRYQNFMNEIYITDMLPAYIDDMSLAEKYPDWYIDIDNIIAQ